MYSRSPLVTDPVRNVTQIEPLTRAGSGSKGPGRVDFRSLDAENIVLGQIWTNEIETEHASQPAIEIEPPAASSAWPESPLHLASVARRRREMQQELGQEQQGGGITDQHRSGEEHSQGAIGAESREHQDREAQRQHPD